MKTMKRKKKGKINYIKVYMVLLLFYITAMAVFYYAGGEELHYRESKGNIGEFGADNIVGDITMERIVEQYFVNQVCFPEEIKVLVSNYDRKAEISGNILLELCIEETGEVLVSRLLAAEEVGLNEYAALTLPGRERNLYGIPMVFRLTSTNGTTGTSATALYSSVRELEEGRFCLDGEPVQGSLCIILQGEDEVWTGSHFVELTLAFGVLFSIVYLFSAWRNSRGKRDLFFSTVLAMRKYGFLINQLVGRDFKVRYKRSVLGILWSFLNPLLTMIVQYVVFSQLFKGGIDNVAVYLLSGLVVFNFFTEAVSQALGSIVYNASLITKVYVPKYIYPVTKVLFSSVNFLISMTALLLVVLITGEPVTKAFWLLSFLIACILMFSIGFGMLMASLMVFFRDIQFLWGIFSLLWMYMTPLFYPESLIAEQFRWIFTGNPMYYYVKFIRSIVLDGISPEPRMYAVCLAFAIGSLLLGGTVFKKTQNKFILNI